MELPALFFPNGHFHFLPPADELAPCAPRPPPRFLPFPPDEPDPDDEPPLLRFPNGHQFRFFPPPAPPEPVLLPFDDLLPFDPEEPLPPR